MKMKNIILVCGIAAAAFWLLSRSGRAQGNQASTGNSYNATIINTEGETIQLHQENGLIVDQHGGVWV